MIKKPQLSDREIIYKRVFLLEVLPEPLTRADEHWQIFDDYAAWPEYRLRQIRIPQTREWIAVKEEIIVSETDNYLKEEVTRTFLPTDAAGAHGPHAEKEIRKNRYFFEFENKEFVIDVFLGALWGLILAGANFAGDSEAARFPAPAFAAFEVSDKGFFRGGNLVHSNFDEVRKAVSNYSR